jgi:drug/metabolite transporter (DMT)-like permease
LPIALGIAAAVLWGTADFLARFATRQIGFFRTLLYMQAVGVSILTVWLAYDGELASVWTAQSRAFWAWVLISGVLSTSATLGFYRSLEIGTLSIVAPVCSVYPALTMLLSMYTGERVTHIHVAGILVSMIGVMLAATSFAPATAATAAMAQPGAQAHAHLTRGVGLALMASALYGINFWVIGYHIATHVSAAMAVWSVRVPGTILLLLIAAPAKQSIRIPPVKTWLLIAGTGIFDAGAFFASSIGLRTGHVSVVTVIGSLFSAVTVFLAWIVLRERLERTQWLGIFLIFIGIILVSV